MKNYRIDSELLDKVENSHVGFKDIICHIFFNFNMDHTRKAKYCSGGHLTDNPSYMTYAELISE